MTFRPNGVGARRPSGDSVRRVDASLADRLAIRDVVETWASARDSGDWDAFRACWHDDGYMMATWFQGPKDDFIRVSQEGVARGVNILHFTGGCRITLNGTRAIAQTRMTIMQRGEVHGTEVGYPVKPDMPGLRGPEVEALYARGAAWLAGDPVAP